jgi:ferric-dicitrate binding protein FerR (iron transport regulator)
VQAYATAVAEYEPKVAAQWAMTLPEGPAREATLQAVYQNWPASDPDGAAAFAREHGLQ